MAPGSVGVVGALGCVLLVGLAGCGAFVAGGDADAGSADPDVGASPAEPGTLTAAPVPTETRTRTVAPSPPSTRDAGDGFPPGISREGVDGPLALATSHLGRLRSRSFVLRTNLSVTGPNGTVYALDQTIRVATGRSRLLFVQTHETDGYPVDVARAPRVELWTNRTVARSRLVRANGTRVLPDDRIRFRGPLMDATGYLRIASLLTGFDVRANATGTGPGAVSLRSAGVTNRAVFETPPLVDRPRNATLSATVESSGLVRSYRLAYDATYEGERVRVVRRFRISGIGSTEVERPAWIGAGNATADDPTGAVVVP